MARSIKEVHTINYYPINEGAARRAKEMNSFSDYKEGSATAEYRAMVDKAAAVAEKQKSRVDPMYHEKIDNLLDTYAITAAFQKYSAKVLNKEQDKASILGQLRKFTEQIRTQAKEKQRTREAVKDGH